MWPCSENRHFWTLILGYFVIKWNLGYQHMLKRPWHKDSEIHLFIPSTKSQAINEISGNSNLLSGGIWWWEIHCVCLPDVSYIILQSHIPTSVNINRAYLPSSIQSSRIEFQKCCVQTGHKAHYPIWRPIHSHNCDVNGHHSLGWWKCSSSRDVAKVKKPLVTEVWLQSQDL
jgi:hypothetical protein